MLAIRIAATAAAAVVYFVGRKKRKRCWLPSGCGEENSQQHNRWSLSLTDVRASRDSYFFFEKYFSAKAKRMPS